MTIAQCQKIRNSEQEDRTLLPQGFQVHETENSKQKEDYLVFQSMLGLTPNQSAPCAPSKRTG